MSRVGHDGELFIVERGKHQITRVDSNQLKIAVAGASEDSSSTSYFNLPATSTLAFASSVSVLSHTELVVADTYNHMIKKVNITAKSVVPFVSRSTLAYPRGTTVVNNDIYFADYGNHCIRKIDSNGAMSDVVGVCGNGGIILNYFIHRVQLLLRMETCSLRIPGITSSEESVGESSQQLLALLVKQSF